MAAPWGCGMISEEGGMGVLERCTPCRTQGRASKRCPLQWNAGAPTELAPPEQRMLLEYEERLWRLRNLVEVELFEHFEHEATLCGPWSPRRRARASDRATLVRLYLHAMLLRSAGELLECQSNEVSSTWQTSVACDMTQTTANYAM